MKKQYIIPEMMTMEIAQSLPIAASLGFGDTVNGVTGDVKEQGEWDIFDYGDDDAPFEE